MVDTMDCEPTNIRHTVCGDMDRIYLAQDRDQWWALVNTVMNLRFHKMLGNF
jgi:hypothetical protein